MPQLVAQDEVGAVQIWTTPLDDHLVVVVPDDGPRRSLSTLAISLIVRTLADQGLLRAFQRNTYLCSERKWHLLQNPAAVRLILAEVMSVVALLGEATFDEVYRTGNMDVRSTREFLARKREIRDWREIPKELASVLTGEQSRIAIPEAAGVIRHPVVGEPQDPWLSDPSGIVPATDGDYTHLRTLFAGMELDPASHVALYSFLLACFHAKSLHVPRPILLVDSWYQSRGKSEVCAAISRLVDDNEHAVSARRDGEQFNDSIISVLRSARTISIDNVDGMREYSLPTIAQGSTGTMEVRHKYNSASTSYQGILTTINLVLGAATFGPDMIVRATRVELTGDPRELHPSPRDYAQQHRQRLISEILAALTEFEPIPFSSRFAVFDGIGLGAYCGLFGADPKQAALDLKRSRDGVWIYHPDVFEGFVAQYRSEIPRLNDTIINGAVKAKMPEQAEGARALSKVLIRKGDQWTWTNEKQNESA